MAREESRANLSGFPLRVDSFPLRMVVYADAHTALSEFRLKDFYTAVRVVIFIEVSLQAQ